MGELEKVPHPQKFEPPFLEKFVSDFSLNLRISSGRGHVSIRNFGKSQEFYCDVTMANSSFSVGKPDPQRGTTTPMMVGAWVSFVEP